MKACSCSLEKLARLVRTDVLRALPDICGAKFPDEGVRHTCTRRVDHIGPHYNIECATLNAWSPTP
jgi:hypothetical protein